MDRAIIAALRREGFDVLTTAESDRTGIEDDEQLEFAARNNRAVYTFNVRHFAQLHREYLETEREHCGIIVIPAQHSDTRTKIRRLVTFLRTTDADDFRNQIAYL